MKRLDILGLVLGLLGLVICCFPLGIPLGIAAIAIGIYSIKQKSGDKIVNILSISFGLLSIIVTIVLFFLPSEEYTPYNSNSQVIEENTINEDEINLVYANPNEYKGKEITIQGRIFTTISSSGEEISFQVYGDTKNSDLNTVVYYSGFNTDIKQGYFVEITGIIEGESISENAFGGNLHLLLLKASSIKIVDATEILAPTTKVINPDIESNKEGYNLKIDKIEFSDTETRVYVSFSNKSSTKYTLLAHAAKITQNGNQYESEFRQYYKELPIDTLGGVTTDGIITFPKIEDDDFTFVIEGYNNIDSYYDIYNFNIDVTP